MKTIPITFLVSALLLTGCDMNKKKVEAQPVQNMEIEETTTVVAPVEESQPIVEDQAAVIPAPVPVERSVAADNPAPAEPTPLAFNESDYADESPEPAYEEQAMEDEWMNEESQKQAMEDERVREFEAKTFNEQQISNDADDYPILFETDELTYNQRQLSY